MSSVREHLEDTVSQLKATGTVVFPDPTVCRADEHPAALMDTWNVAVDALARTPELPRDVVILAVRSAAAAYLRRVDPYLEPVDLSELRRRVAAAHPDRGGSADEFRRAHAAYQRTRGRAVV